VAGAGIASGRAALVTLGVAQFNVSSTLPRTTRSRWFLIRSSSIVMTLFSGLGVVSVMAAPSRLTWLRLATSSQPDSGPPALPICAKDSVRHQKGLRKRELEVKGRDELNAELPQQQRRVLKGSQRALKQSVSHIITVGLKETR
jgi:hypothetical protein